LNDYGILFLEFSMNGFRPVLIFFLVVVSMCPVSVAKKRIVPSEYATIQRAIDECDEGDTVCVLRGEYRLKQPVVMADHIVLMGESPDLTVLRGNGGDPVVKAANNSILLNVTVKLGGTGILSENTNMIIMNNIIRNNANTGIQCLISLPHIQNNIILDNKWSGVFCELVAYGTRTAIEHNIIAHNGYSGVFLSKKSGVLVQNNVFYRNNQYGIFVSEDSRKSRIIFNDFYLNRHEYNNFAIIDATNIGKDPEFPAKPWDNSIVLFGPSQSNTGYSVSGDGRYLIRSGGAKKSDTLALYDNPLADAGKNGAPIGLVTIEGLKKLFKDADEDGIPDEEDRCPEIAEDHDTFTDEDGCPDYDNDEDGLYDSKDACPGEPEDFDGFQDQDGCPDPDNDKDGIADTIDKCPTRPETVNGFKDDDGCPDEKPAEEVIPEKKR
jgi:hypothetical protein